jgi:hypothetical protein
MDEDDNFIDFDLIAGRFHNIKYWKTRKNKFYKLQSPGRVIETFVDYKSGYAGIVIKKEKDIKRQSTDRDITAEEFDEVFDEAFDILYIINEEKGCDYKEGEAQSGIN